MLPSLRSDLMLVYVTIVRRERLGNWEENGEEAMMWPQQR